MKEDTLNELEQIARTTPCVSELLHEYKAIMQSPSLKLYVTLQAQIEDWTDQLTIADGKGKIDLFADKDTKEFDRAFKFFTEALTLSETLEKLRSKLSPKELEDIQKSKKMGKLTGVAI